MEAGQHTETCNFDMLQIIQAEKANRGYKIWSTPPKHSCHTRTCNVVVPQGWTPPGLPALPRHSCQGSYCCPSQLAHSGRARWCSRSIPPPDTYPATHTTWTVDVCALTFKKHEGGERPPTCSSKCLMSCSWLRLAWLPCRM